MKPRSVYLDELTNTSKDYKVKVRVIEKRRPRTSPNKVLYQGLVLQDDKGTTMRGALFAEQVDLYEDAIKHNGVYEITNAPISPLKPEFKTNSTELDYQMSFGKRTIVLPIEVDDGSTAINYRPISLLPRASDYSEMFDIVGVVLFVEDQSRKITTGKKRESIVREIVLIDHSTPQPLSISVWDELAEDACTMLIPVPGQFRPVGLTALRVSSHKGFSMTTSSSTVIIHSPVGEKTEALTAWMTAHHTSLSQLQNRLFNVKLPIPGEKTTKISTLRSKKAKSALQDEKHWLEVTIPDPALHKVNAYMGCSECGKRSNVPQGRTYNCPACSKPGCTSSPKITFNCEISDGTGELPMTAFTSTTEKLFRMSSADIFHMKHADDDQAFSAVQELLRLSPFKVQVGPSTSLSINNILQWVVIHVVTDGDDDAVLPAAPTDGVPAQPNVAAASQVCQIGTAGSYVHPTTSSTASPAESTPIMASNQLADLTGSTIIGNAAPTRPLGDTVLVLEQPQLLKKAKKAKAGSTSTSALLQDSK